MKLLRFAILNLDTGKDIDRQSMEISGTRIDLVPTGEVEGNKTFLIHASRDLPDPPLKDSKGRIVVNQEQRELCEFSIELLSRLLSVFYGCSQSLLSPSPCVVFIFDNEQEKDYLESSKGMRIEQRVEYGTRAPIEFSDTLVNSVSDRIDGIALLSEVYCNSESGKYKEFVRFFELAFALQFTQLEKKLYEFLKPTPYGYTRDEIKEWVSHRHPSTHADMKKTQELSLTSDIRDYLLRMEQAALDVLFNKSKWRERTTERRDLWRPDSCSTSKDGKLVVREGSSLSILFRVYDEFGVYPKNLKASLSEIKDNWYCKFNEDGLSEFPT